MKTDFNWSIECYRIKNSQDLEILKELERYSDVSDSDITTTCFKTRLLKEIYLFISRLQAENERLEAENKKLQANNWEVGNKVGFYALLKAEAYKECIEKVKEYIDTHEHLSCEECECVPISKDGLDNLLKEMVGEK